MNEKLRTLKGLQSTFLAEARSAPKLFADLAQVERYIAESYRSRALIELLQNADDAGASEFRLFRSGDALIASNNGRPFNLQDVESLCRSGASTKERGGGTIGYRGIGFKSTASLARAIAVVSDGFAFRFDRELTRTLLESAVTPPLVRVPHPIEYPDTDPYVEPALADGRRYQHNTCFFFEGINIRLTEEELSSLNAGALLFLRHIRSVTIENFGQRSSFAIERTPVPGRHANLTVRSTTGDDEAVTNSWRVFSSATGPESVACALSETDRVTPLALGESVAHAFMPTIEYAGALLKINGDFSTDPSRKSIDWDERSQGSLGQVVAILAGAIDEALSSGEHLGLFSVFPEIAPPGSIGRLRTELVSMTWAALRDREVVLNHGRYRWADIRLPPDWLTRHDYESLCRRRFADVPLDVLNVHPEFPTFGRLVGLRTLSLHETLQALRDDARLSDIGYAQVLSRITRELRFELDDGKASFLRETPMFPTRNGVQNAAGLGKDQPSSEFCRFLNAQADQGDLRFVLRRIGAGEVAQVWFTEEPAGNPGPAPPPAAPTYSEVVSAGPALARWRSAESNAAIFLRSQPGVLAVEDVSGTNLGYDLEVILRSGRRQFVEVKSVVRLGDPIRLTSNEHATAFERGPDYHLGIVVNGEGDFVMRTVADPIRVLALERRCEKWAWVASEYLEYLREPSFRNT